MRLPCRPRSRRLGRAAAWIPLVLALSLIPRPLPASPLDASGTWSPGPRRFGPSARYGLTAVLDAPRRRMIVFGGFDAARCRDVWAFSLAEPQVWTRLETSGTPPSARYSHAAVYDPVRERMIVFGGDDGHDRADVWALSLSGSPTWSPIEPAGDAPQGRRSPSAIYDPDGDRLLVFGGKRDSVTLHDDCWALSLGDAPAWRRLEPEGTPPSARYRHTAIHDPVRARMVVFGGDDGVDARNDAWELTLGETPRWTRLAQINGNSGRKGHTAVYDSYYDQMVIYGGSDFDGWENDTWGLSFSTHTWHGLTGWGPALLRTRHAAIYDPAGRRMVVFGGEGPMVRAQVMALELWRERTAVQDWTELDAPGFAGALTHDTIRDRLIASSSQMERPFPKLWTRPLEEDGQWTRLQVAGTPPAHPEGASLVFDPVRDRLIFFASSFYHVEGGLTSWSNEVWTVNLAGTPTWTRLGVRPGPAPRYRPTAFYDPLRDRAILVGGRQIDVAMHDVWALSLAGDPAWTRLSSGNGGDGSWPRLGASVVYDAPRDRILAFGGIEGGVVRSSTHAFSLAEPVPVWTEIPASGAPARIWHSVIFDPLRDRMVVFGGSPADHSRNTNDTWSLSLGAAPAWTQEQPAGRLPVPVWGHSTLYDPVRDRMVMAGGWDGWDDSWTLAWNASAHPVVQGAAEVAGAAGEALATRWELTHALGEARIVDWTLTADRSWPGLPLRGRVVVPAGTTVPVEIMVPIPDSARASRLRVRLAAAFAGAAGHAGVAETEVVIRATSVLASLAHAQASAAGVTIAWRVTRDDAATLERRDETGAWTALAALLPDGRGEIAYEDRTVEAGRRYGYRLAWGAGAARAVAGETWVEVPAGVRLALAGTRPHPVAAEVVLDFTLPSRGTARLEVFDAAGRRAAPARVLDLGAGRHVMSMDAWRGLQPGLYVVRLGFDGESVRARVVVAR